MPRQPRLNITNGVYHVTQRGLERRNIVLDDNDREEWFRLLHRHATHCRWRVYAYALLDNHFHIFLKTPEANLSEGMHGFESGYVTLFNKNHQRTGPLFQGRFGSVLVEEDVHAQTLSRYVHLNPYRAGLDLCPGQYAWSSYRYYLDPLGAPTWLDWHTILAELCQREGAARIAYRRFVESGMRAPQKNPLDDVVDGWLLGSKTFIERYQDVPERRQALPNSELAVDVDSFEGTVARPISNSEAPDPCVILTIVAQAFDVDPEDLVARGRHRNRARLAALWLCRERIHESLVELGKRFGGLSPSTVSEALCEASRLRVVEDSFGEKLRKIERVLDGTEGAGSGTSEFGIGR